MLTAILKFFAPQTNVEFPWNYRGLVMPMIGNEECSTVVSCQSVVLDFALDNLEFTTIEDFNDPIDKARLSGAVFYSQSDLLEFSRSLSGFVLSSTYRQAEQRNALGSELFSWFVFEGSVIAHNSPNISKETKVTIAVAYSRLVAHLLHQPSLMGTDNGSLVSYYIDSMESLANSQSTEKLDNFIALIKSISFV